MFTLVWSIAFVHIYSFPNWVLVVSGKFLANKTIKCPAPIAWILDRRCFSLYGIVRLNSTMSRCVYSVGWYERFVFLGVICTGNLPVVYGKKAFNSITSLRSIELNRIFHHSNHQMRTNTNWKPAISLFM